jgi:ketosteroid isomerase-like protein
MDASPSRLRTRTPRLRAGLRICVAALVIVPLVAGGAVAEADGLEARQAEFLAAMAARDADRVAAIFASDAVLQVAGMPELRGREALRGFYANLFRFLEGSEAEPGPLVRSASGELAWGVGTTVNTFGGAEGPVRYTGKYAAVWRRAGEGGEGPWELALYAVSSDEGGGA